ncbi:MAG TPA: exonuclease subunit SbcD [Chloroflexi bacterium]|nr:exonuclease subunit SbcD [Chloroflexota bacterium]
MLRIVHFADAHIDMANRGRHDPETGLPQRVLDFLKALDTIVDAAIREKVDLVMFAGDAYRDRTPAPTFQREWDKRMMRLSAAGIPTLLLVGNHDLSPAAGRAHALHEFETLQIPHLHVLGRPAMLGPAQLEGLPLQVLALPWVSRSAYMATLQLSGLDPEEVYQQLEQALVNIVNEWLEKCDPDLPTVMLAHASVQGAIYGGERSVMLGKDIVLPASLVRDPRLDYVALGHIHKAQNLNQGGYPPVIYPGSIERVDFGEAHDDKCFSMVFLEKQKTKWEWRRIEGRKFIDKSLRLRTIEDLRLPDPPPPLPVIPPDPIAAEQALPTPEQFLARLMAELPPPEEFKDAIMRLVVEYPREWDALLDDGPLRRYAEPAFDFHLVRRPQMQARMRLPEDQGVSSLSPMELLNQYWKTIYTDPPDLRDINRLAEDIITSTSQWTEEGSVDVWDER